MNIQKGNRGNRGKNKLKKKIVNCKQNNKKKEKSSMQETLIEKRY